MLILNLRDLRDNGASVSVVPARFNTNAREADDETSIV
jgi:hypothetical protein